MTKLIGFKDAWVNNNGHLRKSCDRALYCLCHRKLILKIFSDLRRNHIPIPYPLSVSDTSFRFTDGHSRTNLVIIDDVNDSTSNVH